MVSSNLIVESEKLYNSKLSYVKHVNNLQIGKTYVVINISDKCIDKHENKSLFEHNKEYKLIKILSMTPKYDESKIAKSITYDDIHSRSGERFIGIHHWDDRFNNKFDFGEFLAEDSTFFSNYDGVYFKPGWLYVEIEYLDVYNKTKHTDIVYYKHVNYTLEFENANKVLTSKKDVYPINYVSDKIFMSDIFEYDTYKDKQYNDVVRITINKPLEETVKKIKKNDISKILVRNYKAYVANSILKSRSKIIDEFETIEIDGITWYNGFCNEGKGALERGYLFYDDIPYGWRLPTIDELKAMLKKHPLLRKELSQELYDNDIRALRNNAGLECRYNRYFDRKELNVVALDNNRYDDESCYFTNLLKSYNLSCKKEDFVSVCEYTWNNNYKPYLIMLVKMSDDEIQRQYNWANKVCDELFKYSTIDEIYREFGIDLDYVNGLTIEMDVDNKSKTFERKKSNTNLQNLKESIANYIGNDDALKATSIEISFKGDGGIQGSLSFNENNECDLKHFLTKISPLLSYEICKGNINTVNNLSRINYNEWNIYKIANRYWKMGKLPIEMYFYIKDALELIGINHDTINYGKDSWSEYVSTAYITKLIFHMSDGADKELCDIDYGVFCLSKLYTNELDINKCCEKTIKFYEDLNKKLKTK